MRDKVILASVALLFIGACVYLRVSMPPPPPPKTLEQLNRENDIFWGWLDLSMYTMFRQIEAEHGIAVAASIDPFTAASIRASVQAGEPVTLHCCWGTIR
jgi:hypothetical protein